MFERILVSIPSPSGLLQNGAIAEELPGGFQFQSLLLQVSFKTLLDALHYSGRVVSIPSPSGLLQNESARRDPPCGQFQSLLLQVSFKTSGQGGRG